MILKNIEIIYILILNLFYFLFLFFFSITLTHFQESNISLKFIHLESFHPFNQLILLIIFTIIKKKIYK